MHGPLATKTGRAGGASLASMLRSTRAAHRAHRYEVERQGSAQPLGVEIGEAWNAPLGDTWRHILSATGTIGGVRLG